MHLQQSNKKNNERANFEKKIKLFGLVEIAFNRIPHSYLHCWFFFFFSSSSLSSSSFFFIMPLLFFSLLSLYLSLVSFASSVIQPSASSVSLWSSICGARKLNMRKKSPFFYSFEIIWGTRAHKAHIELIVLNEFYTNLQRQKQKCADKMVPLSLFEQYNKRIVCLYVMHQLTSLVF